VRLPAKGTLRRVYRRGDTALFGRLRPTGGCGENATNPKVASGAQQTRDLRAEEAVEVVRNHEDGT
jgi:hypothetical protein